LAVEISILLEKIQVLSGFWQCPHPRVLPKVKILPQILNRPNDPPKIEDHFKIRISLHKREDPSQNRRTLEGETKILQNVYLSSAKRMPSGNPLSVFSTSSVTCLVCPRPQP
jgi:hypothetical protein